MQNDLRNQIVDFVKRDMIGPDPIVSKSELIQNNGEEILQQSPIRRYLAGILFTKGYGNGIDVEEDGSEEDVLSLSNASFQSALGITIASSFNSNINISISFAFYDQSGQDYKRKPIKWSKSATLPSEKNKITKYIVFDEGDRKVSLHIICRHLYQDYGLYTFTLVNDSKNEFNDSTGRFCTFQNEIILENTNGFHSLPTTQKIYCDEDFDSNLMLYSKEKSYAIGHGCSATWTNSTGIITQVSTSIFPEHEMVAIVPSSISGVSLSMKKMSEESQFADTINELKILCNEYEKWIAQQKEIQVEVQYTKTKERHLKCCQSCLSRMKEGVALLESNHLARKAFQYMNLAMLMQQLHFNLPISKWEYNSNNEIQFQKSYTELPIIDDTSTWYGNVEKYGKWRPFQLAFVLINIKSMLLQDSPERKIVDLIWFPTGGGKTEAYLGLSAYTICLRRLKNKNNAGTAILMRYTLRLLTNQQYQRAASLICSLENIRKEHSNDLGSKPITIGLWVGKETTPNSAEEAYDTFQRCLKGELSSNPFIVLKCPWCGSEMGFKDSRNSNWKLSIGYEVSSRPKRFAFKCKNPECEFHNEQLPLEIIDENIYKDSPTLLIGTVDKFATLSFRPEARTIFGLDENGNYKNVPPDLVIQDELHLISGPLGTMVGLYETLIEGLCTINNENIKHFPKIIASTATISKAKEQCKALYCRNSDEIFQFPPSGISYQDSFFAKSTKEGPGRRYIGIYCSNLKYSAVTANIRFYAVLAYARQHIKLKSENETDMYWTHVGYFNSIRELGRMKSYVSQEVYEYIKVLNERYGTTDSIKILNDLELTSRIDSGKIPDALNQLMIHHSPNPTDDDAVDVCLASNMLSVGVDVPRLGLMSVAGQPKTTSEYIQATSRVGRSKEIPGLVFTIYTCSKPRDRSHYEHFQDYHAKIYSFVEPTSVTPFSGPVRERALGAILVAYMRILHPEIERENPILMPKDIWFDAFKKLVIERVSNIAPEEVNNTEKQIAHLVKEWKDKNPSEFGNVFKNPNSYQLITTKGIHSENGYVVPTSMRSVDASCSLSELRGGYGNE